MLLVVGATGDLGSRIVRRLVAAGHELTTLVRPATDAGPLEDQGVRVVRGDLRDAASLPPALVAVDTVITSAAANRPAVDGAGNQHLIRAARRAGVDRFVYVSAAGMSEEMARTGPLMAGKWQAERALRSTGMRAVLVRPDMFQEAWLAPPLIDPRARRALLAGEGRTLQRYVAIDDVADLCVHLATEADPPEVVEFGGPQELTRRQAIAAFEDATGAPYRVRHVPRPVLAVGQRALAHLSPDVALVMGLALFFDTHAATWDDGPLRDAGIVPRPATEFIAASVAAARD